MNFTFSISADRRSIRVRGLAALLLLGGLVYAVYHFAPSLDAVRAEKEIRAYLKTQVWQEAMAGLKDGEPTPENTRAATEWNSAAEDIDRAEFVSIKIRECLLSSIFADSKLFMVRAVLRYPDGEQATRYFSLTCEGYSSAYFWVNEHSRLMWLLSL